MTYHHIPGHPVADIYALADTDWQIEAVDFWQDEAFFHPLTCRRKSSHALLRGAERDGRAVMICPTCGYQQWIPPLVLSAYARRKAVVEARDGAKARGEEEMMQSPHQVFEDVLKMSGCPLAMQRIYRERFGTAMLYWAIEMSQDLREELAPSPEADLAHWLRDAGFGTTDVDDDDGGWR